MVEKTEEQTEQESKVAAIKNGDQVCFLLHQGPGAGGHRNATINRVHPPTERTKQAQEVVARGKRSDLTFEREPGRQDDEFELDTNQVVASYEHGDGAGGFSWGTYHFLEDCGRA